MSIRVTVWGENVHEQKNKVVAEVYPKAIHGTIAAALNADPAIKATTVTLQDAEHGLTAEKIAQTDVLIWWGHAAHGGRCGKTRDPSGTSRRHTSRHRSAPSGGARPCLQGLKPDGYFLTKRQP